MKKDNVKNEVRDTEKNITFPSWLYGCKLGIEKMKRLETEGEHERRDNKLKTKLKNKE